MIKKKSVKSKKTAKVKELPQSKIENSAEALKSLAEKYENILEPQIKVLYLRIVNFIAASQLPLVHVNVVLDLIKKELLKQLKDGYFTKGNE